MMVRLVVFLGLSLFLGAVVYAQDDPEKSHITLKNPAVLSAVEAEEIYQAMKKQLDEAYAGARVPLIEGYQTWKRYNTGPYISATHGRRFVNNFAFGDNGTYGTLKDGESHPVGTVLAKDSITLTDKGTRFPGAMFVMEKLAEGRSPDTGDWRYLMIIPDGTIFGDTLGDDPDLVEYCHLCHEDKADQDYVFFVPEEFRVKR